MPILNSIYDRIQHGPMLALLLDPDKVTGFNGEALLDSVAKSNVDLILVGGSLLFNDVGSLVDAIKARTSTPVVLFPGLSSHFTPKADAVLFLSLLSGRNPDFLIGNQVHAAVPILRSGVEAISTAYILIDGGSKTSVEYMSNTKPIPSNKCDIALATAAAAQLLGFKMVYLEAGSGAQHHVSAKIIATVKENITLPVIVGGGIKSIRALNEVLDAGADIVVVGTAFEDDPLLIDSFCNTVHSRRK